MLTYDPNRDAYAILGVDPEAKPKDISAAYRKAAKIWHPDKSPAPDAAERFHELRVAAEILRDPSTRMEYDRLRRLRLGDRAMYRAKRPPPRARADAPLSPPPTWLEEKVRVHFDAVIFNLKVPSLPTRQGRWADAAGFVCLVVAIALRDVKFAALALVCLFIARVLGTPPHQGILAWAKIVPGRKIAEYHALDRRADRYDTWTVPYMRLGVEVSMAGGSWRITITGFPNAEAPELARTRSIDEARRFAKEAGSWLQLPYREVA